MSPSLLCQYDVYGISSFVLTFCSKKVPPPRQYNNNKKEQVICSNQPTLVFQPKNPGKVTLTRALYAGPLLVLLSFNKNCPSTCSHCTQDNFESVCPAIVTDDRKMTATRATCRACAVHEPDVVGFVMFVMQTDNARIALCKGYRKLNISLCLALNI